MNPPTRREFAAFALAFALLFAWLASSNAPGLDTPATSPDPLTTPTISATVITRATP